MSGKHVVLLPSVPKVLAHLARLDDEIEHAPSLEVVDAIARTAAAYQHAFKPVKDVADRAGKVQARAMRKIGVELAKLPKAKGTRGQLKTAGPGRGKKGKTGGPKPAPPVSEDPTLKDLGVTKKRAAKSKKLADLTTHKFNEIIDDLIESGKPVTTESILAASRQEAKVEKIHKVATAAFSSTGPFDVVVIDPPWDMQKIDRDERPNQDAFDYPTMTFDELKTFWPEKIEPSVAADCHLFCWTTQKYLPIALKLVDWWGFRYVLTMVWHKPGGFQPIGLPQYNAEFAIYARKGTPVFIDTKAFNVCNEWPRQEHSRKPKQFYELIKRVTGGSRIDVFSREKHDGFAQYGNEIEKFGEAAE